MPLVSVVMPIYNSQLYLGEAIKNIMSQTMDDFELILVNDGSLDTSGEEIDRWKAQYPDKIKTIHKENGGTGSALNAGFAIATGEFGTWAASDDVKYPRYLELLSYYLRKHPEVGMAFSAFHHEGVHQDIFLPGDLYDENGIFETFVQESRTKCMTGTCFMFRMSLKKQVGDFAFGAGEDYLMGVKMGIAGKVGYLPVVLGRWRSNPEGLTAQLERGLPLTQQPAVDAMRLAREHG